MVLQDPRFLYLRRNGCSLELGRLQGRLRQRTHTHTPGPLWETDANLAELTTSRKNEQAALNTSTFVARTERCVACKRTRKL